MSARERIAGNVANYVDERTGAAALKMAVDMTKPTGTGKKTCIDCHKGVAHRLPDMTGVPQG